MRDWTIKTRCQLLYIVGQPSNKVHFKTAYRVPLPPVPQPPDHRQQQCLDTKTVWRRVSGSPAPAYTKAPLGPALHQLANGQRSAVDEGSLQERPVQLPRDTGEPAG